MATTFFPTNTASASSGSSGWTHSPTLKVLSLTRGAGAITDTQNTLASLTTAWTIALGAVHPWGSATSITYASGDTDWPAGTLVFISNPLNAVTITSAITTNIRGLESNAMANYTAGCGVMKLSGTTAGAFAGTVSPGSEYGTSEAAKTPSTNAPSVGNALATGDRLAVIFGHVGIGGSATGFTASGFYAGASGATGDTFITFAETITEAPVGRTPRNSAINHQNPAVLMEGMEQDKRNHLWLPKRKRLWRPRIEIPSPAFA